MPNELPLVSERFLNWVKDQIEGTGLLPAGTVFDNREKNLAAVINYQLDSAFNVACVVTYPNIRRVGAEPADTEHEVSVKIVIARDQVLSDVDTFSVSEKLFALFDGSKFYPGATAEQISRRVANVACTGLFNESWETTKARHQINLKATVIIHH